MTVSSQFVSTLVVEAVAESKGVEPEALPTLWESLDPDALDALFARTESGAKQNGSSLVVGFEYAGREVLLRGFDDIEIRTPAPE